MQIDFHYYATYSACILAGYSHEESVDICYSSLFTDFCTRDFLSKINAPLSAATSQKQVELLDAPTDVLGLQDITRIWSSFHFLPGDLYAEKRGTGVYKMKYRLICSPNGALLADVVNNAKDRSYQAIGIAMHVLADTWAHRYFAGTPSLVINNTNSFFYEIMPNGEERRISFSHNPSLKDDPDKSLYVASIYTPGENSIMNLGHGRAGHLPDYSYIRYKYLPAWGEYEEILKDNPSDYYFAFCQMVYALRFLHGNEKEFRLNTYSEDAVAPYKERISAIISKRQILSCDEWRVFGEELSGEKIPDFSMETYTDEYINAKDDARDDTFLGKYVIAAMRQKSLVTGKIFNSGNRLAGFSADYRESGFQGIRDYMKIVEDEIKRKRHHNE